MGNDLSSSNNELLKKLNQTVMQDSWMQGVYGQRRADQVKELKKVFTVLADNDVTSAEKKALEARRETLQDKVERLEAKMAVLEEQLAKNAEEVEKQANAITDLVCAVEDKSEDMEKNHKTFVKMAIEDVFYEYKRGTIERDGIMPEIRRRIADNAYKDRMSSQIEKLLGQLDAKQAEIKPLVDATSRLVDQRNILESQYGSTKSTYKFLNASIEQIGATETNYTNSDLNNAIPVYSLEKTAIVGELFENPTVNVMPGENKNYIEGSKAPGFENITKKYQQYLGKPATGGDRNTMQNQATVALAGAINAGILNDLMSSGLSGNQIAQFFANNFGGANIAMSNGKISIPYGHDTAAHNTYAQLSEFFTNYGSSFKGAINTWDKEGGNTIDSNKQIKALSENYVEILDKMGTQEPKFTFKEAMYSLFNQETGLFRDSGVFYDAKNQENNPNYFIELAGDDETAQMYSNLADKIYDIWGIRPSKGIDYDRVKDGTEDPIVDDGNKVIPSPVRTDPITFRDANNQEFAMIIDKDNDGKFTGKEEFVGATGNWLEDLKSLDANADGKLSGDELKNLKLLGSNYTDNAQTTYAGGKYLREETTNIQYSLTDAAKMGIEEIDLKGLDEKIGQSTGKFDINGSEIFKDSFSFKMNGEEVTASRKDDTNMFMDAVYGDAYGKGYKVGMTEQDADKIISDAYGEFDQFETKYADVLGNINILQNAPQLARDSRDLYNRALDRTNRDESAQLLRASNKAASFSNPNDWSSVSKKVQEVAIQQGIVVDMEQAKGIYTIDGSLSARDIVKKYQEMVSNEQSLANETGVSKEAWAGIIECAKRGIKTSASEIMDLLTSGQAKNAKEVADILYATKGPEPNAAPLEFDSEREEEIYTGFNKVFDEAGLKDKTVEGLYDLCVNQQNDRNYMEGKDAETLAQEIIKKYQ